MLDNFNVVQNLMQNNKDCFYVVSIIQRSKDFENGFNERKHKIEELFLYRNQLTIWEWKIS